MKLNIDLQQYMYLSLIKRLGDSCKYIWIQLATNDVRTRQRQRAVGVFRDSDEKRGFCERLARGRRELP